MLTIFFFWWLIQGHDRHTVLSSSRLWVKLFHTAQPVSAKVSERCAWGVDCAFVWRIKGTGIPLTLIQIMSEFYYLQLCGREPQHFSSCGRDAACSFYQANCCSTRYELLLSSQLFYALHEGGSVLSNTMSGRWGLPFLSQNKHPNPNNNNNKTHRHQEPKWVISCKGNSEWSKREGKKEIGGTCVQYQVTKELGWTILWLFL